MEIKVQGLRKSFGGQVVLDGVDLDIPAGQVTVIIGGSGTGKSVFLKHMLGLIRPDNGAIFIDGQDITAMSEREMMPVRQRIGMLFQGGALLASLSIGENVMLGLVENQLASEDEAEAIAREKLDMVGMGGAFDKYPAEVSGGMLKRASLARALTANPECVLYDEPTAGLDPPRARKIEELIRDLNKKLSTTSVVVTHDMHLARRVANRVHMLHKGRVIFSDAPDALDSATDPVVREFVSQ